MQNENLRGGRGIVSEMSSFQRAFHLTDDKYAKNGRAIAGMKKGVSRKTGEHRADVGLRKFSWDGD